jgi:hypothetical protein
MEIRRIYKMIERTEKMDDLAVRIKSIEVLLGYILRNVNIRMWGMIPDDVTIYVNKLVSEAVLWDHKVKTDKEETFRQESFEATKLEDILGKKFMSAMDRLTELEKMVENIIGIKDTDLQDNLPKKKPGRKLSKTGRKLSKK